MNSNASAGGDLYPPHSGAASGSPILGAFASLPQLRATSAALDSPLAPPMHVVHAVLSLNVGGLERIVLDLIRETRRRGGRVSVVCFEHSGSLASEAGSLGATVVQLGLPPGRGRRVEASTVHALAELNPDVIHTHQSKALWQVGPAARAAGIPLIHTEHNDKVGKAVGWWRKVRTRVLTRLAAQYASKFCCVSADVARSVGRWGTVPASKIETVLNGIDVDRYADASSRAEVRASLGIPQDARVVGTVGRLNEVKRQDLLLRAVAALGPGYEDVRVLLVGDGPERANLERLAADSGLGERTVFAGYQSSPERFLPAMDVFALTSRMEGLPLALLEAWAAGLPVVATTVGGVPEVVADGETGLLVPSGDEAAVTAALRRLLSDRGAADRLAAAGRTAVRERFSLERMASEYEARYRALMASRTKTR